MLQSGTHPIEKRARWSNGCFFSSQNIDTNQRQRNQQHLQTFKRVLPRRLPISFRAANQILPKTCTFGKRYIIHACARMFITFGLFNISCLIWCHCPQANMWCLQCDCTTPITHIVQIVFTSRVATQCKHIKPAHNLRTTVYSIY